MQKTGYGHDLDPQKYKNSFPEDYWLEAVELDEVQELLGIDFTDGD